ncbi:actin nucleation-promoting factor WAS-like [Symphalangus syndactylus]|uniref:actin nucleation-promoting factor WAS-like n=1 Tax=Symphalangus syndactylus TaxID=9590 RepID=UPI003005A59E
MPSPELSRPGWGVGPGGGGWGPGLPARCELPNSGARRAGPRGEGVPRRDLGGGRPLPESSPPPPLLKKNKRVGKSQPHAGPPPAHGSASLPPGSALLRPEFSIPWIPGSRGRGEEDPGKPSLASSPSRLPCWNPAWKNGGGNPMRRNMGSLERPRPTPTPS